MKSVCEERHEHLDERCSMHQRSIDTLFEKIDCIIKNQQKFQWLIIGALITLCIDIVRGMIVLDNVMKVVK